MNFSVFEEIAALTATYRAVMGIESVAAQETSRGSNPEVRNAGIGIDPAPATDLYDIRLTRQGLDGEALEPRIGRLLTSDPEQAARDMCDAITARGNPARIETVEIVRAYGAQVFVVRERI